MVEPKVELRPVAMLVDIEKGNRTEGEHILGDIVRHGEAEGISVPVLTAALCYGQEVARALGSTTPFLAISRQVRAMTSRTASLCPRVT